MLNFNFLNFNFSIESGFSLLLLNILIYLIILISTFLIFFFFNSYNFRTLNQFKEFLAFKFIYLVITFNLLSFAGIPPLSGFVGKFLFVIFFLFKNQFFYFILFSIMNLFMLFFYIQNLRFLIKKTKNSSIFFLKNIILLSKSIFFLVLFSFFNILAVFFFHDLLVILNNYTIYINMG